MIDISIIYQYMKRVSPKKRSGVSLATGCKRAIFGLHREINHKLPLLEFDYQFFNHVEHCYRIIYHLLSYGFLHDAKDIIKIHHQNGCRSLVP